jgi:hypothetical protein
MDAVLRAAFAALLAAGPAVQAAGDEVAPPAVRVSVAPSGVSVSARAAPLEDVLRELSRVTGVAVYFEEALDSRITRRPTTLALRDIPVEDAFRRVLRDTNFIVGYGADRLDQVRVFGQGSGPFNRLAVPPGRPAGGAGQPPPAVAAGRDATAADVPALESAALTHPDPEQRLSALTRLSDVADESRTREVALAVLDRDQHSDVLREALTIIEMQEQLPRDRLMRFAASGRPAELRIQVLDILADSGTNDAAFRQLVTVLARDQDEEVRQRALEILEDLEGDGTAAGR